LTTRPGTGPGWCLAPTSPTQMGMYSRVGGGNGVEPLLAFSISVPDYGHRSQTAGHRLPVLRHEGLQRLVLRDTDRSSGSSCCEKDCAVCSARHEGVCEVRAYATDVGVCDHDARVSREDG